MDKQNASLTRNDSRTHVTIGHDARPHLFFIYAPVIEGLKLALRAIGAPFRVMVATSHELLTDRRNELLDEIAPGDLFVWVGVSGVNAEVFAAAKVRGAVTVYYQTEPVITSGGTKHASAKSCRHYEHGPSLDEIWDFSHQNIDECSHAPRAPRVTRYMPLMAAHWPQVVQRGNPETPPRLVMFGRSKCCGREKCWNAIVQQVAREPLFLAHSRTNESLSPQSILHRRIHSTHGEATVELGVTDNASFATFLEQPGVGIFLNFHKSPCEKRCANRRGVLSCSRFDAPVYVH
jgi:hypothetical protein